MRKTRDNALTKLRPPPSAADANVKLVSRTSVPNPGTIVWFTGLSGSGKTTLCRAVAHQLSSRGVLVEVLDADALRRTVCAGLGFTRADREENIHRIAAIAEANALSGITVLVAAIAPYRSMRQHLRRRFPSFVEVYVNAPLETCIARDPKGLYRRALAHEIDAFTGISDPYEPPLTPDIECHTDRETIAASTSHLLHSLDCLLALREPQAHVA